jgi:hypothetical protein
MTKQEMTLEEKMCAVEARARGQGGFVTIDHIRRAAGLKTGDGLATKMEKARRLLHVAHDLYKLPTTEVEREMAARDAAPRKRTRRGRGSY